MKKVLKYKNSFLNSNKHLIMKFVNTKHLIVREMVIDEQKMEIPNKMIGLIKMTMKSFNAAVFTQDEVTKKNSIKMIMENKETSTKKYVKNSHKIVLCNRNKFLTSRNEERIRVVE